MLRHLFTFLAIACFFGHTAQAADAVGFRAVTVSPAGGGRSLDMGIWYPAKGSRTPTPVGDNPAFVSLPVVKDAQPTPGRHPLVVMSHGYGGNWTNQAWLADALVRQGYIVAATNHPGTTSRDMNTPMSGRLWERPHDLSRVIDALLMDSALASLIASDRIAVIGHSLGGWTAIEIAGGRLDPGRLTADCQTHPVLAACAVYREIHAGEDSASKAMLGTDLKDMRVKAAVSLDLGLARGFDPASLAAVDVPVLVIAAGAPNPKIPARLESGYLADHLPAATTRYVELADAAHFSFLPICKPGAAAMIEEETPGDGIVCQDGGGHDRAAIHQQVADLIIAFLMDALPQK